MKKLTTFHLPIILIFIQFSCIRPKPRPVPEGYKPAATSNCDLPDQSWMETRNGYDSKTVLDLATKFEAAAKADLERIKVLDSAKANAMGSFTSKFTEVVKANSTQVVQVSQEFYENYRAKRDALCALRMILKDTNISATERQRMESLYTDLLMSWASIKKEEEKKK